ncbi:MAG TPA: HAMP domain-containing sensor histidine kinase, partial [Planctomycetota bacterium]|nr:HAMP domain-containing sensor histidine kinase [Planctomycetota bacterium]
ERIDPDHPYFWTDLQGRLDRTALFRSYLVVEGDPGGTLSTRLSSRDVPPLAREDEEAFRVVLESGKTRVRGASAYVALGAVRKRPLAARLVLPESTSAVEEVAQTVHGVVLVMGIGIVVILLTTYVLLNRFVLRPLNRLAESSEAVAAGDYTKRLPEPSTHDEMGRTFRAFNFMLGRLDDYNRRVVEELRKSHTELKDTRTRLVRAQRLSSTGTLASGIAHEINNPLSGLINMAQELRSGSLAEDRRRHYLDLILEGLARIRATMDKILLFVPRPATIREVSIEEVARKVAALVEHRLRDRGMKLDLDGLSKVPTLRGDSAELQQVFLNLVLNAVDACREGEGRVRIYADNGDEPPHVVVEDNGVGMNEEEIRNSFLPFYTTKEEGKGTGLGLPVAKSIVESYGGDIYIESSKGQGTRVHVVLPRSRTTEAGPSGAPQGP